MLTAAGTVPVFHRIPFSFSPGETKDVAKIVTLNRMWHRILISFFIALCSIQAHGQRAASDTTAWQPLQAALQLNDMQWIFVDSMYRSADAAIRACDKEISRIARSASDSTTRQESISNLKVRKQTIRDERDAAIEWILTAEQRTAFRQYTQPGKPAVIHMGMNHDRASCAVCIPKKPKP
jgi:hypothetical protein